MIEFDYDLENENILKELKKVNTKFAELLADHVIQYSNKGTLEADNSLSKLENDIIDKLRQSGYNDVIEKYINFFGKILNSTIKNYSNVSSIEQTLSKAKAAQTVVETTIDSLKKLGIRDNFINPLSQQIRQLITNGATYSDFKNYLKNTIIDSPRLTTYISGIAVTAFTQYDGTLQSEIKNKYDCKKFYYVGGEISTSRPFCIHMKDTFKNGLITDEQLKEVLDEYCPNGKPSEKTIGITVDEKTKYIKKGAGMKENTFVSNFPSNVGGYECRHKVRYIIE